MALVGLSLIFASVVWYSFMFRGPPLVESLLALWRRNSQQIQQAPPGSSPSTSSSASSSTSATPSSLGKEDETKDTEAHNSPSNGDSLSPVPARVNVESDNVHINITLQPQPEPTPEPSALAPQTPPSENNSAHSTPRAKAISPNPQQNGPQNRIPSIPSLSLGDSSPSRLMPPPTLPSSVPSISLMPPPPPPSQPPSLSPLPTNNAITLAPPARPLPNRGPPRQPGTSTLAPPSTHNSKPANPSRAVVLTPGHSPLDWARLSGDPTVDMRGLPPDTSYLRVTPSMLRAQTGRRGKDAWTALGGRVYNITPYVNFHPGGGPELLRAAGRDGTKLFGEIHPWVNYEGMLQSCLVGLLVEEGASREENGKLDEQD